MFTCNKRQRTSQVLAKVPWESGRAVDGIRMYLWCRPSRLMET